MIKINVLVFMVMIEVLFILIAVSVFLFLQRKKLSTKTIISQGEIKRLENELESRNNEIVAYLNIRNMFTDLQRKFEETKSVNAKLKEAIDVLIPEAERSKEFEQLLTQIEKSNKELDTCVETLQKENEALNEQMVSSEKEIRSLSGRLQDSVNKEEYQNVLSAKKGLELKVESLKGALAQKTSDLERLEKNFIYLEKEYNALYKNVKGEEP